MYNFLSHSKVEDMIPHWLYKQGHYSTKLQHTYQNQGINTDTVLFKPQILSLFHQ